MARARSLGQWITQRLTASGYHVRGSGLMLGIEMKNAAALTKALLKQGIIALPCGPHQEILALTPPYVITRRQLDHALRVIMELAPPS